MRLSKIKTKEIRYVVWKYRLKRFLPHILTLCLAVIVAGGAFSAYSVYHKKHQKQLAKQSEVQREKDVNTARKKAQKEKTTLKPWYTYHSIAHAMGGLDGKDYLNSIDGFYPAYQKGYRVFEMDILLTKDNVAIGKHQWGWKLSDPTSKKGDPVSYRKFKNTKIYGKYTPTSFLDVLNLMEKYPDFYLMTDSKSTEPADAKWRLDNMHETYLKDMNSKYVYPNVFMSIDDTNKVSQYDTDIKKYAEQKKADWILNGGIEKEWDFYLKKMEQYGLSDYISIKQKYFDEYQKSLSEEK